MQCNLTLHIKRSVSYSYKKVKQSCYFAKVCDREFNKKQIGVDLFSLQLSLTEYRLTLLCRKDTTFVLRCWGLLPEDSGAIVRNFDKSQKQHPNIMCIFKFSIKYLCSFYNRERFFIYNKISSRFFKNCFSKTVGGA